MQTDVLDRLARAIIDGDRDKARSVSEEALAAGVPPLVALEEGARRGLEVIGERFAKYEVFLPELMLAGNAMSVVVSVLLDSLPADEMEARRPGRIVIGTVTGDIHDIGKNIVSAMLKGSGFEVVDLGVDVAAKDFLRKAREVEADIIALSALLTTSMPYQEEVVRYLEDSGTRDRHFIVVGGGPVTPEWAKELRADGYGRTAADAVSLCRQLVTLAPPLSKPLILD
jgi:corrinoid protein of di/trimethylamine methyltransferase